MTSFITKKIEPSKRVCLRLTELREQAGITIEDIAHKTKLNKSHILALEQCRFEDLPGTKLYHKNFIKSYIKALGLQAEPFIQQFVREEGAEEVPVQTLARPTLSFSAFHNIPSLFRIVGISLVLFVLIGYLVLQVRNILQPPQLTLFAPLNGYITDNTAIDISGQTEKEVSIYINGKEIANNEKGQFSETIHLSGGVNTIVVEAQRRYGKKASELRYITVKDGKHVQSSLSPAL